MVVPKHRIANFNFVSPFMSTEHTNKCLIDSGIDLLWSRPSFCPSVKGPRSVSPSPIDFSSPLEVNYAKCVLAQNRMDIKLDNTPDLANQHSWANQADDRMVFPQSNMSLNQNEVIIPNPATHY